MNSWLREILTAEIPNKNCLQEAIKATLANKSAAQAFDITAVNVSDRIQQRWELFKSTSLDFRQFCQTKLQKNLEIEVEEMLPVFWDYWLPIAIQIAEKHKKLQRPFIQGILGGQGTGKTTTCAILSLILSKLGYRTLGLSIDDLYKTYHQRRELQQKDPRLIWRGPPGTHEIEIALKLFDRILHNQSPYEVPRFDKSLHHGAGDRTIPEIVEHVDIILFEGWFVGVRPINPELFNNPPHPIVTDEDKIFARDINAKLFDYLPLWEKLDSLIVLYPVDYRLSVEWRKQAEQQMIASGKSGMSDPEIEQFVNYFWRSLHPELFITPLVKSAKLVDLVIEIEADHSFGKVYKPVEA